MQLAHFLSALIVGLFLGGCAVPQGGISAETRTSLAPTGKLRVAFLSAPIYAAKDPATGELKGVAVDLGKELAQRMNVPFDAVVYPTFPELMSGARSGQWDVALMGVDPERAKVVDFSAPFMNVEQGFLLRTGGHDCDSIGGGCRGSSGRSSREEQPRCSSVTDVEERHHRPC